MCRASGAIKLKSCTANIKASSLSKICVLVQHACMHYHKANESAIEKLQCIAITRIKLIDLINVGWSLKLANSNCAVWLKAAAAAEKASNVVWKVERFSWWKIYGIVLPWQYCWMLKEECEKNSHFPYVWEPLHTFNIPLGNKFKCMHRGKHLNSIFNGERN